jgi:hypothetical protein
MRRILLATAAVTLVAVTGWWAIGLRRAEGGQYPIPGERYQVAVEVLNAIGVDGLARDATMRLRERGLDVVSFGNAGFDTLSLTRVVARRGDTTVARHVQGALGVGVVVDDEDPRRLLDVSIYLGRDALPALGRSP